MDRLQAMEAFVKVVETGGFSHAAEALELPRASVSAAVQQLERHLGVRLLHRTTRRVELTVDGAAYFERCVRLLADFEETDSLFAQEGAAIRGTLKLEVPGRLARRVIIPALPQFFARHPQIRLQLGANDRYVDPLRDGLDGVVRGGEWLDERLVARRLGALPQANWAAPSYLARFGEPRSLADLAQHYVVGYRAAPGDAAQDWIYDEDGIERSLPMNSLLTVDNADAYLAAGLAGLGLVQMPVYGLTAERDAGRLRSVLDDWRPAPLPVTLQYPPQRHLSRRLRAFADWLAELFAADPLLHGE